MSFKFKLTITLYIVVLWSVHFCSIESRSNAYHLSLVMTHWNMKRMKLQHVFVVVLEGYYSWGGSVSRRELERWDWSLNWLAVGPGSKILHGNWRNIVILDSKSDCRVGCEDFLGEWNRNKAGLQRVIRRDIAICHMCRLKGCKG